VHAVRGSDVSLTMIDGMAVVENGELKSANLAEIIANARAAAPALFARRDALRV
jgi:5-methylthioadenosine/S-adenosylhomocysteine deaminase